MGNCGSNPKTNEGPEVAAPESVTEDLKVEQKETNTEVTTNVDSDKSLGTLLIEKVEEAPKTEEVKADEAKPEEEPKTEVQKEKPEAEETTTKA